MAISLAVYYLAKKALHIHIQPHGNYCSLNSQNLLLSILYTQIFESYVFKIWSTHPIFSVHMLSSVTHAKYMHYYSILWSFQAYTALIAVSSSVCDQKGRNKHYQ